MAEGLRSQTGASAPPYTNGPYVWDQFMQFTGGLAGTLIGSKGTIYYVDEENGSDSNDGLSPEKAFATILKATGLARDDYSDDAEYHIFIFPGTYTETEDLRLYGHGIHLHGMGHPGTDSGVNILATNATYGTILLAGANCTIENIQFRCDVDKVGIYLLAADNSVIRNNVFKGVSGTTTTAIQGMDVRSTHIIDNLIGEAGGDFTNGIYMEGGADYYCIDSYIARNRIYADGAAAKGILIDNTCTTYGNVIDGNWINLGKATGASIGIDNNSTGCNIISNNIVCMASGDTPIESASSPTGIIHNASMAGTTVVDPNSAKS